MTFTPQILNARIMHKRVRPKLHQFFYSVFYLAIPLSRLNSLNDGWRFGVNRRALLSFRTSDFGPRKEGGSDDGSDLKFWVRARLLEQGFESVNRVDEIVLVTMPRILGYLFNPVSFYFCYTANGDLLAVLSEVNNTFGETHSYICVPGSGQPIGSHDWLEAEKQFHVSPFYQRDGLYQFRFEKSAERLTIQIDYRGDDGEQNLMTSVSGNLVEFNRRNLSRAFWTHPLQTLMVTARIHWHALRLWRKGMKYIAKPLQYATKHSRTNRVVTRRFVHREDSPTESAMQSSHSRTSMRSHTGLGSNEHPKQSGI